MELAGVTERETSAGGLTVRIVDPTTKPNVAVMVEVPCARAVASPWLPAELLILATAELEDDQITCEETFNVEPPEYFPVAVKRTVAPFEMEGEAGETEMEVKATPEPVRLTS